MYEGLVSVSEVTCQLFMTRPYMHAVFIFKSVDAIKCALEEPLKRIDGHQMICKLAVVVLKGMDIKVFLQKREFLRSCSIHHRECALQDFQGATIL